MQRLTDEQVELVEKNLALVGFVMKLKFCEKTVTRFRDELESAGMGGLMSAASRYDPEKGKFSTFATRCIWNRQWAVIRSRKSYKNSFVTFNSDLICPPSKMNSVCLEVTELSTGEGELDRLDSEWDARESLPKLLAKFHVTQSEVDLFRMRYAEERTLQDIGEELGIPPTTVQKRILSVKNRVRQQAVRWAKKEVECAH